MLIVSIPDFGRGARATIVRYHAQAGDRLDPGSALMDLEVDLSGGVMRDCPPQSTCRIFLREGAWLKRLLPLPAEALACGAFAAELSEESEGGGAMPGREARVTVAAIVHHGDWWDE